MGAALCLIAMSESLVPDSNWEASNPYRQRTYRSARVAAQDSLLVPLSAASFSCCARVVVGDCCQINWVTAAGWPAGDGCESGRRLGSRSGCARRSSTGCAMWRHSTGVRPAWTASESANRKRVRRAQSRRSWQSRVAVPPRRRERHPAGCAPVGRQCPRRNPVAPISRCHPTRRRAVR